MASFSGADESALRQSIDKHKGAAKKKSSLPTSVKELTQTLICDMKVPEADVNACTVQKDLIDLYVKQLSIKDMEELLDVNLV